MARPPTSTRFPNGLIVVSLIDNYARPLFIGPIVLAVFVATIRVFDPEYDALGDDSAETDDDSKRARRAS